MKMKMLLSMAAISLAIILAYAAPVGERSRRWGIIVTPCAWCETTNEIQVHHIYPQSGWPERRYDTNNMICLCRKCHVQLGHRGNTRRAVTNLIRMLEEGRK